MRELKTSTEKILTICSNAAGSVNILPFWGDVLTTVSRFEILTELSGQRGESKNHKTICL
jgi:hypothetical protein